ncbi:MAG: hypothetical protein ACI4J0_03175 [Huintestinicola sp.]|uniref:hypothetical protein n=1 Tax=Huintestinicola sp. TaxID=2981661 RepID=UPI003EFDFC50
MTAEEAYTETSATDRSEPVPGSAETGTPVWALLLAGIAAMVLIYIVTVFLPKIAAAVDRLLGRENKETPPPKEEEYRVCDIYEGEKDLDDDKME